MISVQLPTNGLSLCTWFLLHIHTSYGCWVWCSGALVVAAEPMDFVLDNFIWHTWHIRSMQMVSTLHRPPTQKVDRTSIWPPKITKSIRFEQWNLCCANHDEIEYENWKFSIMQLCVFAGESHANLNMHKKLAIALAELSISSHERHTHCQLMLKYRTIWAVVVLDKANKNKLGKKQTKNGAAAVQQLFHIEPNLYDRRRTIRCPQKLSASS